MYATKKERKKGRLKMPPPWQHLAAVKLLLQSQTACGNRQRDNNEFRTYLARLISRKQTQTTLKMSEADCVCVCVALPPTIVPLKATTTRVLGLISSLSGEKQSRVGRGAV